MRSMTVSVQEEELARQREEMQRQHEEDMKRQRDEIARHAEEVARHKAELAKHNEVGGRGGKGSTKLQSSDKTPGAIRGGALMFSPDAKRGRHNFLLTVSSGFQGQRCARVLCVYDTLSRGKRIEICGS